MLPKLSPSSVFKHNHEDVLEELKTKLPEFYDFEIIFQEKVLHNTLTGSPYFRHNQYCHTLNIIQSSILTLRRVYVKVQVKFVPLKNYHPDATICVNRTTYPCELYEYSLSSRATVQEIKEKLESDTKVKCNCQQLSLSAHDDARICELIIYRRLTRTLELDMYALPHPQSRWVRCKQDLCFPLLLILTCQLTQATQIVASIKEALNDDNDIKDIILSETYHYGLKIIWYRIVRSDSNVFYVQVRFQDSTVIIVKCTRTTRVAALKSLKPFNGNLDGWRLCADGNTLSEKSFIVDVVEPNDFIDVSTLQYGGMFHAISGRDGYDYLKNRETPMPLEVKFFNPHGPSTAPLNQITILYTSTEDAISKILEARHLIMEMTKMENQNNNETEL